jgi:hypothetical protein
MNKPTMDNVRAHMTEAVRAMWLALEADIRARVEANK